MKYIAHPPRPPLDPLLENERELNNTPVLVVLHGYGTDEYDLLPIAEKVSGGKFLIISLQGPIELSHGGHAWYDLLQTPDGIIPDDITRHQSEEQLVASLPGIIAREGGDAQQVLFLGFSQGAAVLYSLLTIYDLRNYGITPIASINMSGYLPRDIFEALGTKRFDGFPFFISHGEYDELIASRALGEAENRLSDQGAEVTGKIYSCGHGVLPETIDDILEWMEQETLKSFSQSLESHKS